MTGIPVVSAVLLWTHAFAYRWSKSSGMSSGPESENPNPFGLIEIRESCSEPPMDRRYSCTLVTQE